jgi:hypothetical protein
MCISGIAVSITTGWMVHNSGFDSGRSKIFLFTASRPALRPTQPPMQWLLGALSLGIKQQGWEVDHAPQSITEVKIAELQYSLPHTS